MLRVQIYTGVFFHTSNDSLKCRGCISQPFDLRAGALLCPETKLCPLSFVLLCPLSIALSNNGRVVQEKAPHQSNPELLLDTLSEVLQKCRKKGISFLLIFICFIQFLLSGTISLKYY